MGAYYLQITHSLLVFIPYLIIRYLVRNNIHRIAKQFKFGVERTKVVCRISNLLLTLLSGILIAGIWGVHGKDFLFFITSTVTVLGIAFFAQWSVLSNITSGLVLFFSHPLKIGDQIRIIEKDFILEGRLIDISIFFLHLRTADGKNITIPNSLVLQRTILLEPDDTLSQQPTKAGQSVTYIPS
ncbi:MAG TPA: mechanosensitive ion channel domain-containing protein [Cytophagales bacterium]|nr:mechanosensitive ion channel domain-containing protein [Cytophagales bacterium]